MTVKTVTKYLLQNLFNSVELHSTLFGVLLMYLEVIEFIL